MKNPRLRYGKVPMEILTDQRVSDRAARLFGIIAAHAFEGNTASVGVRRLSKLLGVSKSDVHRKLKELKDAKHIAAGAVVKNGSRSVYVLLSPVFAQRQGRETVIRSAPSGVPRMVSVEEMPKTGT